MQLFYAFDGCHFPPFQKWQFFKYGFCFWLLFLLFGFIGLQIQEPCLETVDTCRLFCFVLFLFGTYLGFEDI